MDLKSSRSQQAYRLLHERIALGELGPGAVVSEASLARELGISRTPIGEALRRLAHEGLVEQVPRFGTIVRQISADELTELFEIREALEGFAAARAAERITPGALAELAGLCDTLEAIVVTATAAGASLLEGESLRRFLAADMALHMLIIASAGNQRMCELVQQTRGVSLMFKARRGEHSIARVERANIAHRSILAALADRNGEAARRLVVDHISTSRVESLGSAAPAAAAVTLKSISLPEFIRQDLAELER